jgi:hypothetical protein
MTKKLGGPTRTKEQREYDLKEISGLYLQGWIQAEIAAHINKTRSYDITRQTITRDIKTIQQRWLESSVRNFDEARAEELAKVDNLELTYWSQFEASKDPIVKRRTSKKVDGETTEATQEVSLGTGDPRFLQGVQWCIDRRCKLLGLDAPTRSEVTGAGGVPLFTISDMTQAAKELKDWEDENNPDTDPD